MKGVRITQIPLEDRVLLLGPPGVGKTEVIRQKAEEEARRLNRRFVDLRVYIPDDIFQHPEKYYAFLRIVAPHVFPEDLGMPKQLGEYVEFLPPKLLKVFSLRDVAGVLFIDELTNVQREDQISMYYSLILEKEASWTLRLADNVKIVAAGNPPEWSRAARPLPEPLRSRMTIIRVLPPTPQEWAAYMQKRYEAWERLAALYLSVYPDDLLRPPQDDFAAFPTPRSWTRLAVLLVRYFDAPEELKDELIMGTIGEEVGTRFAALLHTRLDINAALHKLEIDPKAFENYMLNERLLILHAVAQQPLDRLAGPLRRFMEYLANEQRELFIVLLLSMDAQKRRQVVTIYSSALMSIIEHIAQYVV